MRKHLVRLIIISSVIVSLENIVATSIMSSSLEGQEQSENMQVLQVTNSAVKPTVEYPQNPSWLDLDPTERAMEEMKAQLLQEQIQTVTAIALSGIVPTPSPTVEITGSGVFPIEVGVRKVSFGSIIDLILDLPLKRSFEVQNAWTATIDGYQVIVYAGYERNQPEQGGIFVQWGEITNLHPDYPTRYYPLPFKINTPVRIVDARDGVIILSDNQETTISFDLMNARYLGVEEQLRPSVEPYPIP